MNLRRATLLLLIGAGYTLLHKVAYWRFPFLQVPSIGHSVTSVMWLGATSALILFAYQFLREVSPCDRRMRWSLVAVIVFTSGVILARLPIWPRGAWQPAGRLLFGLSALCNSLAILVVLVSFRRHVPRSSPMWAPTRAAILTCGAGFVLGLVSAWYRLTYLLTGREVDPLPFLQPLAMLVFLLTTGTTIWFLIRFARIDDYREFADD